MFAVFALPAFGQANLGPNTSPHENWTWFAGSILYPTVQSAVTAACASVGGIVRKSYATPAADSPTASPGGCTSVIIEDDSAGLSLPLPGPAQRMCWKYLSAASPKFTGSAAYFSGTVPSTTLSTGVYIGENSGLPDITYASMTAGTNLKTWDSMADGSGVFHWRTVNDAYTTANDYMTIARSGFVPASVTFPPPVILSSTLAVTGATTLASVSANAAASFTGNIVPAAPFPATGVYLGHDASYTDILMNQHLGGTDSPNWDIVVDPNSVATLEFRAVNTRILFRRTG